jgi:hypothetical protein
MIRCRCGTWTDWGLTCVNCRTEAYRNLSNKPSVDDLEDTPPLVDDDDDDDELVEDDD